MLAGLSGCGEGDDESWRLSDCLCADVLTPVGDDFRQLSDGQALPRNTLLWTATALEPLGLFDAAGRQVPFVRHVLEADPESEAQAVKAYEPVGLLEPGVYTLRFDRGDDLSFSVTDVVDTDVPSAPVMTPNGDSEVRVSHEAALVVLRRAEGESLGFSPMHGTIVGASVDPFDIASERLFGLEIGAFDIAGNFSGWVPAGGGDVAPVESHAWEHLDAIEQPPRLVASGKRACLLADNGAYTCWGFDTTGGTRTAAARALALHDQKECTIDAYAELSCEVMPPGGFVSLAIGAGFTCALDGQGRVLCVPLLSTALPEDEPYSEIVAGAGHLCGLTESGAIHCAGDDDAWGRLQAPAGTFTHLAAGLSHTCALDAAGLANCWGSDSHGQASPPSDAFVELSAGSRSSCGLRSDGSVACWGSAADGQLDVPAETFTMIASGESFSCGTTAGGELLCWGDGAKYGYLLEDAQTWAAAQMR